MQRSLVYVFDKLVTESGLIVQEEMPRGHRCFYKIEYILIIMDKGVLVPIKCYLRIALCKTLTLEQTALPQQLSFLIFCNRD